MWRTKKLEPEILKHFATMNLLEQLKTYTKVVADTGDFESIRRYRPVDSTTNPSLILAAAQNEKYAHLIKDAVKTASNASLSSSRRIRLAMDLIAVNFGLEILKVVPGRVSTEIDARLSFDTRGTIERAREIIGLYESAGVSRKRILVKVAATWEGIKAAEQLEKEGINCNLTLLFSKAQAIRCAEAGVYLISPFVGRILDWHKKERGFSSASASEDPGVRSVTEIYHYFKKFGYSTIVMGASFRTKEEILELAGCDALTISPALLQELEQSEGELERKLDPETSCKMPVERILMDEKTFRWMMNEDAMATDRLADGIRKFSEDLVKLESFVMSRYPEI